MASSGGKLKVQRHRERLRAQGALFENDGYLSPVHAEITLQPNGSGRVRDLLVTEFMIN